MKIINSGWLPAILILIMLVFFTGCSNFKPTALVTGALSKHINDPRKRDEVNPLLGLEFKRYQVGFYDNSRLKPSLSVYGAYRWLDYPIAKMPVHITSKVGAALYDNQSGYPYSLKPVLTLGGRFNLDKYLSLDLDYMPKSLISEGDVASLTVLYQFGGAK